MTVVYELGYLEKDYLSSGYLAGEIGIGTGMEVNFQTQQPGNTGSQVDLRIFDSDSIGMEVKIGDLGHFICEKYLAAGDGGYLTNYYLTARICAHQGMQAEFFIDSPNDDHREGMQVDFRINDSDSTGMETIFRVFDEHLTGSQVEFIKAVKTSMQASFALYNITQLRILCDFASRGTPALGGNNWTSPQGTEPGDFALTNLNTDLLEQRAQSPTGTVALWELRCDTGQTNTFVDTIAILEHNFTSSASVQVQGSDDPNFLTVKFSFNMVTELVNMYYIAPTLPTVPARYYRFTIQDPTNGDNHLFVGTILFGSAVIWSRRTCYQDPVTYGRRHFKQTLRTEGFTSQSNDRAMRKFLGLEFQQVKMDGGDYRLFTNYFSEAKTDLKCLVIPRPTRPSVLAVFSKLVQLPEEQHTAIEDTDWYVGFSLAWDESE